MPEGHTVHRIARQFQHNFVGRQAHVTSPQGRFALEAAEIDGEVMTAARAIGKHLLLGFGERWLHVHLGIYGAWDFAGEIEQAASLAGSLAPSDAGDAAGQQGENEESVLSIGAPRRARLRAGETEQVFELAEWPPEPVGQVRVRIQTDTALADLRGPTVCELLDEEGVAQLTARLGPDPQALTESKKSAEARFVERVRRSKQPVGQLLMDQSVVSGIGNVYRAELLFRAGISPHRPGVNLTDEEAVALWRDWVKLLETGVSTGYMLTIARLRGARLQAAIDHIEERHWVYKRAGLPCRRCGTPITLEMMQQRKLYWCTTCQT